MRSGINFKVASGELFWVMAAALAGALVFVVGQSLAGFPMNIAQFMGSEIVRRGGYSPELAGPIGWGVHLGVATTYAAAYAAIVRGPFFPKPKGVRWGAGLGLAVLMGWLTTLITAPAIAITIGVLSGQGVPGSLPPLNTAFGFVFWNHVVFFLVSFAVSVLARGEVSSRRTARAGAHEAIGTA